MNLTNVTFITEIKTSVPTLVIYTFLYAVAFIFGLVGNILVVYVVITVNYMRTTVNCFIMNLALADIMVCLFCLPATLITHILNGWRLGAMMCKVVPFLQGVSVSTSVNTLAAIAIDRFLSLYLDNPIHRRGATIMLLSIWLLSIAFISPWLFVYEVFDDPSVRFMESPDLKFKQCWSTFPSVLVEKLYFVCVIFLTCYIIPLLIITVCYSLIMHKVWSRYSPGVVMQGAEVIRRSRSRVLKMLLTVTVLFVVSWSPLYIFHFTFYFSEGVYVEHLFPIAHWISLANSCYNPLIYCYYSKRFRASFSAAACRLRCCTFSSMRRHYSLHVYLRKINVDTDSSSNKRRRTDMLKKKERQSSLVPLPFRPSRSSTRSARQPSPVIYCPMDRRASNAACYPNGQALDAIGHDRRLSSSAKLGSAKVYLELPTQNGHYRSQSSTQRRVSSCSIINRNKSKSTEGKYFDANFNETMKVKSDQYLSPSFQPPVIETEF